jgi:hypothetical protein
MAFEPGNKLGTGRPKGASNKTTSELRQLLTGFVQDNWKVIQENFNGLTVDDKINVLVKVLPFVLPKLAPVEAPPEEPALTRQELIKEFLSRIPSEELMQMIDEIGHE